MRMLPPNSASMPRPRRKMRPGALMSMSRPTASIRRRRRTGAPEGPAAARVPRFGRVSPTWGCRGWAGRSRGPFPARAVRIAQVDAARHTWAHGKRPGDRQIAARDEDGVERRIDERTLSSRDVDGARHAGTGHVDVPDRPRRPPVETAPVPSKLTRPPLIEASSARSSSTRRNVGATTRAPVVECARTRRRGPAGRLRRDRSDNWPLIGSRGNEPVGERQWQTARGDPVDTPAFEAHTPVGARR
jgi:hypothetical protein